MFQDIKAPIIVVLHLIKCLYGGGSLRDLAYHCRLFTAIHGGEYVCCDAARPNALFFQELAFCHLKIRWQNATIRWADRTAGGWVGGGGRRDFNATRAKTRCTTCMRTKGVSRKHTKELITQGLSEVLRAAVLCHERSGHALDCAHHRGLEYIIPYHGLCYCERWCIHCRRNDRPSGRTHSALRRGEHRVPFSSRRAMACEKLSLSARISRKKPSSYGAE